MSTQAGAWGWHGSYWMDSNPIRSYHPHPPISPNVDFHLWWVRTGIANFLSVSIIDILNHNGNIFLPCAWSRAHYLSPWFVKFVGWLKGRVEQLMRNYPMYKFHEWKSYDTVSPTKVCSSYEIVFLPLIILFLTKYIQHWERVASHRTMVGVSLSESVSNVSSIQMSRIWLVKKIQCCGWSCPKFRANQSAVESDTKIPEWGQYNNTNLRKDGQWIQSTPNQQPPCRNQWCIGQ